MQRKRHATLDGVVLRHGAGAGLAAALTACRAPATVCVIVPPVSPQLLLLLHTHSAAVLATWAPLCGGKVPEELYLPFADIRMLAPDAFVDLLATTLHVERVVVGENYRC